MSTKIACPACGSNRIVMTEDMIRDLGILRCEACGESYAFSRHDLYALGSNVILYEWYLSYRGLGDGQR